MLASSSIDTDSEDHETEDGDDLDQSKVELNFSVELDWHEVGSGDNDPEAADEDGLTQIRSPVLDNDTTRSEFESVTRSPSPPIDPAHRETERRVDETAGVCGERSSDRKECTHLS